MKIRDGLKLDFDDVLIVPKRSTLDTRQSVSLQREFTTLNSQQKFQCIPICAANMDGVGSFSMAKSLAKLGCLTALKKHYIIEELINFFKNNAMRFKVLYTIGQNDNDFNKLKQVQEGLEDYLFPQFLCIDVANGYTKRFHDFVKLCRKKMPSSIIMAGNVATPEMVQQLLESGADIVKIGIGSGQCCTTRIMTGIGFPQLSAISECADAAHGYGGLVCSDGGCQTPGDVCKAFACGADIVMLGSMLAGADECEGQRFRKRKPSNHVESDISTKWFDKEDDFKNLDTNYIEFYGMSSKNAMDKHSDSIAHYRASEGRRIFIEEKGPVAGLMKSILGGLRSSCTYVGASKLKHLPKCATFIRVPHK